MRMRLIWTEEIWEYAKMELMFEISDLREKAAETARRQECLRY